MCLKKVFIIILFFVLQLSNASALEPDVLVQSTVDKASKILSKNITK